MEKPNPELYNSEGHYEADLEKYNEMKKVPCSKCKREFNMPVDFMGTIFCEDCEQFKAQQRYSLEDMRNCFNAAKEGKIERVPVVIDQYGATNIEEHFVPNKYPTFEDYIKAEPSQSNFYCHQWNQNVGLCMQQCEQCKLQTQPSQDVASKFKTEEEFWKYKRNYGKPASEYVVSDEDIEKMAEQQYPSEYDYISDDTFDRIAFIKGAKAYKAALDKQVLPSDKETFDEMSKEEIWQKWQSDKKQLWNYIMGL